MNSNRLLMIHPGRILLEEFLGPLKANKRLAFGQRHRCSRAGYLRDRPGTTTDRSPTASPTASRITSARLGAVGWDGFAWR